MFGEVMSISYPNGIVRNTIQNKEIKKVKNMAKGKLGEDFESRINSSNDFYRTKKIACIYKKPTPIQVVSVSYPKRQMAKITEAYYKTPSTTDYNGIYREKYIDFEAKSCHSDSFSFLRIYVHQIEHLKLIQELGGISFLLIEFPLRKKVFLLPTSLLVEQFELSKNGGRKSIPYSYFEENGVEIKEAYLPSIDYLEAVDKVFF